MDHATAVPMHATLAKAASGQANCWNAKSATVLCARGHGRTCPQRVLQPPANATSLSTQNHVCMLEARAGQATVVEAVISSKAVRFT